MSKFISVVKFKVKPEEENNFNEKIANEDSKLDSLMSIVQMPPGIPVATMSIGKGGARNAGIYAASILGIKYPEIRESVNNFRQNLKKKVMKAAEKHNK